VFLVAGGAFLASAAESYRVTFFKESVVNETVLKPGDYRVTVDAGKAVIAGGGRKVEADVKVEASETRFGSTSVRYRNGDGKFRLYEIRIGGTSTKLLFDR
jgi:hypothetical protein